MSKRLCLYDFDKIARIFNIQKLKLIYLTQSFSLVHENLRSMSLILTSQILLFPSRLHNYHEVKTLHVQPPLHQITIKSLLKSSICMWY